MGCKIQGGPAAPVYQVDWQGHAYGSEWLIDNILDISADDIDKSWDVPDGQEWQILWIEIRLATTATAGDRELEVLVERPGAAMAPTGHWATAGTTQAASLVRYYIFAPGLADLTDFRGTDTDRLTTPLPVTDILQGGDRLRVREYTGTDASDDMNVFIQYAWREVDR